MKSETVRELERQLREAKGPPLFERIKRVLAGEGAFKVKTLCFLACVGFLVAWVCYLAVTTQLDAIGLMITHFLPFSILLSAVVVLALVITYAVVYIRNSDCFDRHNATSEARKIRDRIGTPDEKLGDPAAVAEMYSANTRFIIWLIAASIFAFAAFVAISAFSPVL